MDRRKRSTTRRKSIVLIDKKGQTQEFNRSSKNESQIKEDKGEESINSQKERRAMDNKEKICNCEMCNADKGKCEKCKRVKNCDCNCNKGNESFRSSNENKNQMNNENKNEMNNLPGNTSLNSNKDINEVTNESIISNSMMSNKQNESIKQVALVENQPNASMNQNLSIDRNTSMDGIASISKPSLNQPGMNQNESISKPNTSINQPNLVQNEAISKPNTSINQPNTSINQPSMSGKTAGAVTGAMAGGGAGIILGKSAEEEKKMKEDDFQTIPTNENVPLDEKRMSERHKNTPKSVTIDEDRNKEYSISKDSDKSLPLNEEEKADGKTHSTDINKGFTPPIISDDNLPVDSEIRTERQNNNIVGEGHMWKRRRIFACFWHEKYFVLTKDGILKYHRANGTKYAKGNWDIKKANRIHEVFLGSESHPYRLALICDGDNLLFGYDDPDTREFWYNQFSKFIDF